MTGVRDLNTNTEKPERLYFKTYLKLVHNSVGSEMFRNFYIRLKDGSEIDALSDGSNSCAFFVSSVLTIFNKLQGIHGTVTGIENDLEASGWDKLKGDDLREGDVIVWKAIEIEGQIFEHVGFYVGDGRAISTSMSAKKVTMHDLHFGEMNRPVKQIFRRKVW